MRTLIFMVIVTYFFISLTAFGHGIHKATDTNHYYDVTYCTQGFNKLFPSMLLGFKFGRYYFKDIIN